MERHILISRSQRWLRLARTIAARQLLTARSAKYRQLAQALGLHESTAEPMAHRRIVPEQTIDRTDPPVPFPAGLAFRPPLTMQVEDADDLPSAIYETEDTPEQQEASVDQFVEEIFHESESNMPAKFAAQESPPTSTTEPVAFASPGSHSQEDAPDAYVSEPLAPDPSESFMASTLAESIPEGEESEVLAETQSGEQQTPVANLTSPVEVVTPKRRRGSIQETPIDTDRAQSAAPPSRQAHKHGSQKGDATRKEAHLGQQDKEMPAANTLFAPRDTDRSPQAWAARLLGTASASRTGTTPPEVDQAIEQKDIQIEKSTGKQSAHAPQAIVSRQPISNGDISFSTERPRIVKPPTEGTRKPEASKRPATSTAANIARDEGQAMAAAMPLSLQAKQFLEPLIGIDLEDIPVYRDATAAQVTGAYHADAVTVGEQLEVAAGHLDDAPETLGLLAHEFTHVARQRIPRFIPPIARTRPDQPAVTDEETLARRVEGRVKRAAQERVERIEPLSSDSLKETEGLLTGKTNSIPAPRSPGETENWGGLPAPWEPLPDWFVSQPPSVEDSTPHMIDTSQPDHLGRETAPPGKDGAPDTPGGANQMSFAGSPGKAYEGDGGTGLIASRDGPVQRAGTERSADEDEAQATAHSSSDRLHAPDADLDALAQQVYVRLKRRLGVEYRREG